MPYRKHRMKTTDFLKALPLLPASWLSSLIQQNKPLPQRQQRAEQWAKSLLKTLGYSLTVKGVENIPLDETIYFVSNHQGTLDPVLVLASCPVHVAFISKKENEKIGDDWNDFISYTEKAHSEIASQAKYNIKEYVMNSNFDAERMEVLKSWFPFLYEDGLTEGKTEARAQTQQGIIQLLQARFGELPQDIESNLKKMEDDSRLSKLIVVAGMATSLEDVAKAIKQN